jgi:hypothetical protein
MKKPEDWENHKPDGRNYYDRWSRNLINKDVSVRGYSPKYDAYYNVETREWIEKTCGHEDCEFCKDRPEKYIRPKA